MPNFDQTGPNGEGPETGFKRGKCTGDKVGRGRKRFCKSASNRKRGFCNNTLSLDEEEKILEDRLESIRQTKKANSNK